MAIVRYLLAILVLVLQDDPAVKTRRLIDRLRSENIAEREEATKGLKELGEAAKPELEKAAKDADAEFASRARYLLRRLELRATLSSNLLKAVPDAADRLADGAGSAWTEVFQQATAYDERGMNRRFEPVPRFWAREPRRKNDQRFPPSRFGGCGPGCPPRSRCCRILTPWWVFKPFRFSAWPARRGLRRWPIC
jgi:hypothetical protein